MSHTEQLKMHILKQLYASIRLKKLLHCCTAGTWELHAHNAKIIVKYGLCYQSLVGNMTQTSEICQTCTAHGAMHAVFIFTLQCSHVSLHKHKQCILYKCNGLHSKLVVEID